MTDRNNIGKLLSFINPTLTKKGLDPFTIQVEMTAQTAIFCREETATYEVTGPGEFWGFDHEFKKASTITQVKGSTGHHRIVSYRLGDLSFLVRHETDGFCGNLKPVVKDDESTRNNLANMLGTLSLSLDTTSTDETSVQSKLTIKREGRVVPRESTLEIKTRVFHKILKLPEVAPQLWVSQTSKLVRAYHQRGKFSTPKVEDMTAAVKDWEQTHQDDIKRLVTLINRILRVTRNSDGSSTIYYDLLKDKLVIKKIAGKKMLPDDLYSRWTKTIPVSIPQKVSEYGPSLTQKRSDTRRRAAAVDPPPSGIKVEPTKLQHGENVATTALVRKSES